MEKPFIVAIEELKKNITDDINNSNLHVYFLDGILKDFYLSVHEIYLRQAEQEKIEYENYLKDNNK